MIKYKCKCGEKLLVKTNTEASRKTKAIFKKTHRTRYGYNRQEGSTEVHNLGHGYTRTIARKEET